MSGGAGAIWEYPPFLIEPKECAKQWVLQSLIAFTKLAAFPDSGVVERRVSYHFRSKFCPVPPGAESVQGFGHCNGVLSDNKTLLHRSSSVPEEVDSEEWPSCYWYRAPVIHMQSYLPWLRARLTENGTEFIQHTVTSLSDPLPFTHAMPIALVVNCAGVNGGKLSGSDSSPMHAVRGSLVLVQCPLLQHVFNDESHSGPELCYVVPQRDGLVALAGCSDPLDCRLEVDAAEIDAIRSRCERFVPQLRQCPVVRTWVGFRPQRKGGVRLELERIVGQSSSPIILHNYGHGGSGVVTSWGCAEAVGRLALQVLGVSAVRKENASLARL